MAATVARVLVDGVICGAWCGVWHLFYAWRDARHALEDGRGR